jgi:TRAP-type C4-dicarboxylate transport system permease small subunit
LVPIHRRFFRAVAVIERVLLIGFGAVLVLVVSLGVFYRYVLKAPLSWTYELSILVFIWVTFVGASVALQQGAHVTFDFIVRGLPEPWPKAMNVTGLIIVAALSVLGLIFGYRVFSSTVSQSFQTIPFSRGWMYAGLPVGMILMFIHSIELILNTFTKDTQQ